MEQKKLTIAVVHDDAVGGIVVDALGAGAVDLAVALEHVVAAAVEAARAVLVRVRALERGAAARADLVLAPGGGLARVVAVGLALAPELLFSVETIPVRSVFCA